MSIFHYLSLHSSQFFSGSHDDRDLKESDRYSDCLLRLPMYFDLTIEEVDKICTKISDFFYLEENPAFAEKVLDQVNGV